MQIEGRSVVRSVKQLQLHPAIDKIGWTGVIEEFNDALEIKDQAVPEPILVTTSGTILDGFGRWRLAVFEDKQEILSIFSLVSAPLLRCKH